MTGSRLVIVSSCWAWLYLSGLASGEVGVVRHSDGTAGMLTPLGDEISIYSDAHGDTKPVIHPTLPSPGPHGDHPPGSLTPFGTPTPPNNLTPAPVLPISPNRPIFPQQPVSPPFSSPPPGFQPQSSSGPFGR